MRRQKNWVAVGVGWGWVALDPPMITKQSELQWDILHRSFRKHCDWDGDGSCSCTVGFSYRSESGIVLDEISTDGNK